jgi:hypothetical protein
MKCLYKLPIRAVPAGTPMYLERCLHDLLEAYLQWHDEVVMSGRTSILKGRRQGDKNGVLGRCSQSNR